MSGGVGCSGGRAHERMSQRKKRLRIRRKEESERMVHGRDEEQAK